MRSFARIIATKPMRVRSWKYQPLTIEGEPMSEKKNRLSEAIESAVEKTLNSAAEATSPHPEEYWYNLKTGEVERGQRSAVTSLWGPFKTYEEAAHAMERARERNEAWDKDSDWS